MKIVKHLKSGKYYIELGRGKNTTNGDDDEQRMVCYSPMVTCEESMFFMEEKKFDKEFESHLKVLT